MVCQFNGLECHYRLLRRHQGKIDYETFIHPYFKESEAIKSTNFAFDQEKVKLLNISTSKVSGYFDRQLLSGQRQTHGDTQMALMALPGLLKWLITLKTTSK